MYEIDYRDYVDMTSPAFKGKDSMEVARILTQGDREHIYRMYFLERLEIVVEKFFDRLEAYADRKV